MASTGGAGEQLHQLEYFFRSFFWLASQAMLVGVFLFPAITVLAVAGLIAAGVAAALDPEPLRGKWKWLLLPFGFPVIILAYGVVFHQDTSTCCAPAWRAQVLYVLLAAHVVVSLVLVAVARRNPLVPFGLSGFQIFLSFSASFMSGMSVTGIWL